MVTTKSRKGKQLPRTSTAGKDVVAKVRAQRTLAQRTLKKAVVPRAAGARSTGRKQRLAVRAVARRREEMSDEGSETESDLMEADVTLGNKGMDTDEGRDDNHEEEDSEEEEGDVPLLDLVHGGNAARPAMRSESPREERHNRQVRHAVAGQAVVRVSAARGLLHAEGDSSDEDGSDEGEELGSAAETNPGRLPDDWSPTSRFEGIVEDIKTLSQKLGPDMAKKLRETDRLTKYGEFLEDNGVVETRVSLRVRVEKVGRDNVFDHVKFATAMNVDLFRHSGSVMRMVCKELNLEACEVDANRWAKMVRWVRKGLADRRNSTRSMLRTEVRGT
jgi:hypothetical protein